MPLREIAALRVLCFDLENRPLAYFQPNAVISLVVSPSYQWSDEPDVQTLLLTRTGRYLADNGRTIAYKAAHERFREVLCSAGIVYGHNIRRHDLPMFQA